MDLLIIISVAIFAFSFVAAVVFVNAKWIKVALNILAASSAFVAIFVFSMAAYDFTFLDILAGRSIIVGKPPKELSLVTVYSLNIIILPALYIFIYKLLQYIFFKKEYKQMEEEEKLRVEKAKQFFENEKNKERITDDKCSVCGYEYKAKKIGNEETVSVGDVSFTYVHAGSYLLKACPKCKGITFHGRSFTA